MGDMLSQDEINALLSGASLDDDDDSSDFSAVPSSESKFGLEPEPIDYDGVLSTEEKDVLGEIGNISMGTAATTLFALLGRKVLITTPHVTVNTWGDIRSSYTRPCVGTRIDYVEGLRGSNVLVLAQHDVKIITNLMMGGEGSVDDAVPLGDIELSAIGEAMNQMIGSSSTSISQMIKMKIDIGTPQAFLMESASTDYFENFGFTDDEKVACVSFRMEVDSLIDSKIMQLLPVEFAIDMVKKLRGDMLNSSAAAKPTQPPPAAPAPTPAPAAAAPPPPVQAPAPEAVPVYAQPQYMPPPQAQPPVMQNVNVQPVQFQSFDVNSLMQQKENMGIVMDVPLEISVELGRTKKKIREILEFTPGTIVELDKMAGEPIDILVNGKFVAKGEVVVVMDENFGIRITDIVGVEDRI